MTDTAEHPDNETPPQIQQPGLRFLEAAVYIMGGLLVLMLVGLIAGIVWKVTHRSEVPQPLSQGLDLDLPAGTVVEKLLLDGDRLVLQAGPQIIVIDIRKNYVVSRIRTVPK